MESEWDEATYNISEEKKRLIPSTIDELSGGITGAFEKYGMGGGLPVPGAGLFPTYEERKKKKRLEEERKAKQEFRIPLL